MKNLILLLLFITAHANATKPTDPLNDQADQAAKALLMGLKTKLMEEMSKQGIVRAASFCSLKAIPLTEELQKQINPNWEFKRLSLKNRNPENTADSLDTQAIKILENDSKIPRYWIEEKNSAGLTLASRYYKPIRIEAGCIACHGKAELINPEIKKLLKEKYPTDKATGYQIGDFRGVLRIRIPR